MAHLGDFRTGKVVRFTFTTVTTTGAPTQLAGTPAVSVYKDASTTQSTTGVTLTVDFDAVTGLNHVAVDTSADGTFYSAGSDFSVVITAGTVGGTSAVGYTVGSFSLENRSALMPTTDGRKLDVSAGGEAGVDWANVGSPTTTVGLSGTTVKTATDVETDTADIQSRLPAALGANGNIKADVRDFNGTAGTFASGRPEVNTSHIAGSAVSTSSAQIGVNVVNAGGTAWGSGAITAASIAADAITAAKIADGAIDAATFAAGAINAAAIADGAIDRATFAAETGLQTVRSNTAQAGAASTITLDASASATNDVYNDLLIYLTGGTGAGQAAWITDYVGATKVATVKPAWVTQPDNTTTFAILPAASVWHQIMADHVVSGSTGASLNAAGGAGDPWTTSLPGAYGAGTAGYIVGTYLDAAVTSRLAPTTSGRTLDVTATGAAGIDWGNVENPTTVVGLSGTTVKTATDVETDTADIQSRLPAALVSGRMDASVGAYQTGLTPLQPTVSGRTLDVTATGEAGIDWANIGGATTTVNLSGTTVKAVTDNVNAVLANAAQGGSSAVLTLERLVVASATTNEPAVKLTGNGTGAGLLATSGSGATGDGIKAVAASTDGNGINALGSGSGDGMHLEGGTTGHGLHARGGASGMAGIKAISLGGNAPGLHCAGNGSGPGISAAAGDTGTGILIGGGATSGNGITVTTTSGHGISIAATGTSKHGVTITGGNGGTSDALVLAAGTGGVGCRLDTLTTSGAVTINALAVSGATTLTGAVTASNASNNIVGIDVAKVSGDATAADNLELFFDGTGYNASASAVGTVANVTTVNGLAAGVITAAAVATGAIDADALAADAVAEIWTTALTESYGTDGSTLTGAQLLYLTYAGVLEHAISSTTKTLKKLDGSTTAATFTLDDATSPSSITRTT